LSRIRGVLRRWRSRLSFYEKSERVWKARHAYRRARLAEWRKRHDFRHERSRYWRRRNRPELVEKWQALAIEAHRAVEKWEELANEAARWLARRRREQSAARRVIARWTEKLRDSSGSARAVRWAKAQVGVSESPPGSNSGPKINDWIRASGGQPGWPWCQYFANAVMRQGGAPNIPSGYTVQVVQWARERRYGLRLVPKSERKPGDLVFFKFPGVSSDFCDHVGVYVGDGVTVEGNTSPGVSGSQNNGGGVYRRVRPMSQVVAVVRPDYRN
jgi:hypothetical protein